MPLLQITSDQAVKSIAQEGAAMGQPATQLGATVTAETGTGGLVGIWRTVANLSGISAIIIFAFLMWKDLEKRMDQYISDAKEERAMYRDELQKLRSSSDERTAKMEVVHQKALDSLGSKIERACIAMEKAANKIQDDHKPPPNRVGDGGP